MPATSGAEGYGKGSWGLDRSIEHLQGEPAATKCRHPTAGYRINSNVGLNLFLLPAGAGEEVNTSGFLRASSSRFEQWRRRPTRALF